MKPIVHTTLYFRRFVKISLKYMSLNYSLKTEGDGELNKATTQFPISNKVVEYFHLKPTTDNRGIVVQVFFCCIYLHISV